MCMLLPCSDQFCIDIVGMLSIGKALQGGDSRWVSSITIHNELLRRGCQVRSHHPTSTSYPTEATYPNALALQQMKQAW